MNELLDSRLRSAGHTPVDDPRVTEALLALTADRAQQSRPHRRRRLIPVLSFTLGLGLLGTGAAVATQWGPWTYVTDPDIAITRDWVDATGADVGTCESRLATDALSPNERKAARGYLASLDIDNLEPDGEYVATILSAVGRPDDLGRLIAGADIDDYDITTTGPLWNDAAWTDARVLQAGLTQTVVYNLGKKMKADWPEAAEGLASNIETQCSTDPGSTVAP